MQIVLFLCSFFLLAGTAHAQQALPPDYLAKYNQVAACMGVKSVPKPPKIKFTKTVACPTSGRMCCLPEKFFPCPWDAKLRCGAAGRYKADKRLILIPNQCVLSFNHEAVHHLLKRTTGSADAAHKSGFFGTCGDANNVTK